MPNKPIYIILIIIILAIFGVFVYGIVSYQLFNKPVRFLAEPENCMPRIYESPEDFESKGSSLRAKLFGWHCYAY